MAQTRETLKSARVLVVGLLAVLVVLGGVLILLTIGNVGRAAPEEAADALAQSTDTCVTCHRQVSPGIVKQYSSSSMAGAEVSCQNCHEVDADYPGAIAHEGTYVLNTPTTAKCETCHEKETEEYLQSRHGLPAYVAVAGTTEMPADLVAQYQSIPEGGYAPDKSRNQLAAIEGKEITNFACETCHDVGAPGIDNSVGQCQKCHLRHEFSLEQARKPETCNNCHIGPDHPQWEIYHESPHGIAYSTGGMDWNWDAEPGTLSSEDMTAATCATCHISNFGTQETTHDVGDRLTWYLFAPISERRPEWETNKTRMQGVCQECHNASFIATFYENADIATEHVNEWVKQSNEMMAPLKEQGLITAEPFDEPIDFVYYELWHHWGRTAKFGVWMQGADYVQWHGAYEVVKALEELEALIEEKIAGSGK